MFTFTVSENVTIERPIEEVFEFLCDHENDIEWCPAVKEIKQVSGSGPGVGAVYQMHHTPGGMDFDAEVEVVSHERPRLIRWIMTDSGHTIRGAYELEARNGRTHLTQTSEVTFEGWLRIPGLIMKRSIAGEVKEELGKQFANLKQILESESAPVSEERQTQPA